MKAMVIRGFGGPDVFTLEDFEKPKPGANELLVRVRAASVNPVDIKIRSGMPYGVKLPAILGFDVSGVVEEVGALVKGFAAGDEVFYTPGLRGYGSYAEYNVVEEAIAERKPANLSHEEAASIPLAGSTAWQSLAERGGLRVGETVLIQGGGGGVGSLAVQIAKAAGAYVYATCGGYDMDRVRGLGADRAIDYRGEDFLKIVRGEGGADLVLDTIGKETLSRSLQSAKPGGRVVNIVNIEGSLDGVYRNNVTLHMMFMQRRKTTLTSLRQMIERGLIRPVIDSIMPLEDVAEAHRRLEKRGVKGKLVLKVD